MASSDDESNRCVLRFSLISRMFEYAWEFAYAAARSQRRGDPVNISITSSISWPYFPIGITDLRYVGRRILTNDRFNFKRRDSHLDLLIRTSWQTEWYDSIRRAWRLGYPTVRTVPGSIDLLVVAIVRPASCAIGFAIGNYYCQFPARTRPVSSESRRRLMNDIRRVASREVTEVAGNRPGDTAAIHDESDDPDEREPVVLNFNCAPVALKEGGFRWVFMSIVK